MTDQAGVWKLRDAAFERIDADAERYANQAYAIAVFLEEPLFAYTIRQRHEIEFHAQRAVEAAKHPGEILLFPEEFEELRYRAAYQGAGLAAVPPENIPDNVHHRLANNLENYPPKAAEYRQIYTPWTYLFTLDALRATLRHDFSIAASDNADGTLYELALEAEKEKVENDPDEDDSLSEPGAYIEEAFAAYAPGTDAEEITTSAFLRAGYMPPFDGQWFRDVERVVQGMIDDEARDSAD